MKPILILDAGGVIIEDLSTQSWAVIAAKSKLRNLEVTALYKQYKKEVSEKLWTGQLSEQQFIEFLSSYEIQLTLSDLREIMISCLTPLPAFEKVKAWSTQLPIYIMSNHITYWLKPALLPIQPYLTDIYVSDAFKVKKPNPDWFNHISARLSDSTIMFVDNTMHNIEAAKVAGWSTIFADDAHAWIDEVDRWIAQTATIKQ